MISFYNKKNGQKLPAFYYPSSGNRNVLRKFPLELSSSAASPASRGEDLPPSFRTGFTARTRMKKWWHHSKLAAFRVVLWGERRP